MSAIGVFIVQSPGYNSSLLVSAHSLLLLYPFVVTSNAATTSGQSSCSFESTNDMHAYIWNTGSSCSC